MTQTMPWCCVACMASLLASDSCTSACASSEKSCRLVSPGYALICCCAVPLRAMLCLAVVSCPDLPSPAPLYPDLPCPVMPCPACPTLCCAVLCCAVLCCAVLCCAVLCLVANAAPSHSHQLTSSHQYHVTGKTNMPIHF